MQKFPMTVQGHAALETELKHLKSVERPEIINAISVARDREDEANVKDGKISVTSPIARAMITKEVGDVFEVIAPGGSKGYEILEVDYK